MSRIGKKPVLVPNGVNIDINGNHISVEGPLGKLEWSFRPEVSVQCDEAGKTISVARENDDRQNRAFHGLTRAMIQNMVTGVTQGYEKRLVVVGVGYLAAVVEGQLHLRVGFSHEVHLDIPPELNVVCSDHTHVIIKGTDKQKVGQFAAEVRAVRKPEPYKGKGIHYEGEHVRRKTGKAVGA